MVPIATELGVAYLSLTASTKDFAKEVRKALGEVEQESGTTGKRSGSALGKGMTKGLKVVGGAVAGVVATVGGLALYGGISRALQIEDAQAKLTGLGHSADAVGTIMDSALDSVRGTAFGLGEAATVAASTVAAGVKPGEDLTRSLKLVADAATIAGTDLSTMGSIVNKVATSDMMQMDVANQLMDAGIPILQMVADEMGVTAGEARKLASEGKVSFETFQNALETGLGGAALASGDTFRGSMANAGAALSRLGESVVSGVLPQIKDGFGDAITILDSWAPHAEAAGEAIGSALATTVEWVRGTLIPTIRDTVTWMRESATTVKVVAAVVGAALLPVLLSTVAAWVRTEVAAIRSAAAQFASHYKVVAGWVMSAAAAVRSGAQTVAIWALYRIEAAKSAAAVVAAHARMAVGAVVNAARTVGAWVLMGAQSVVQAGRVVGAWALAAAASVRQGAVMAASMAATAARTVAGWVFMGAQSMIQAARMAAAWVIAMGPVGWVIAAVVGLVALIVANWDTVVAWTKTAWEAVTSWISTAWQNIVAWVTSAVEAVRDVITTVFAFIGAAITAYVTAWRTVITTVWNAIQAVVTTVVNAVRKVIDTVFSAIKTAITTYVNAWRTVIATVWGAIQAVVSGAVSGVKRSIEGLASIVGRVREWFGNVKSAIVDRFNEAVNFVKSIPSRIVSALGNVSTLLKDAGRKIIEGLADGIRGAVGKATDAIRGVTQRIRDYLPFSPAKVGPFSGRGAPERSGAAVAGDFAKGMLSQERHLASASARLMGAAALVPGRSAVPAGALAGGGDRSSSAFPDTITLVDVDGSILTRARVVASDVVASRERDAAGRSSTRGAAW